MPSTPSFMVVILQRCAGLYQSRAILFAANEQHELLIAMLRRSGELPDTIVSDDQLVGIAEELFQTLDAEESDDEDADSR
ncbi:MAG: hypothetical protein ACQESR_20360 [Planctomycetota bacterium]